MSSNSLVEYNKNFQIYPQKLLCASAHNCMKFTVELHFLSCHAQCYTAILPVFFLKKVGENYIK
jgi:hypothetical protein